MAERARLESVCTGNRTAGSNPALSATSARARPSCLDARRPVARPTRQWRRGRVRTRVGGWSGGARAGRVRSRGGRVVGATRVAPRPAGAEGDGWRLCKQVAYAVRVPPQSRPSHEPHLASVMPWEARSPGPARRRPRTSSGPEGSSDKGITPGAAVPPGSLVRHGITTGVRGPGSGFRTTATFGTPSRGRRGSDRGGKGLNLTTTPHPHTERIGLGRSLSPVPCPLVEVRA